MSRCRCGHRRAEHEHYRDGDDCGYCDCDHYRRRWWWHR